MIRVRILSSHHADIPSVDIEPLQARVEIDTKPFAGKDHIGIGVIEFPQPIADRPGAVGQQLLPAGIERLEIDSAIDFLDQIVLAGKVAIEQRLGHAEPARQVARPAAKPFFREKLRRLGDELLAAVVRRQPLLLRASTLGRCFLSHDLGAAGRRRPRETGRSRRGQTAAALAGYTIGLDRTEENHMVAAIISIGGTALEICDAVREQRRVAKARRPFHAGELVVRRFCEFGRQRLLRCAEHVDREMAGVLEDAQPLRKHPQAPEHQRRVERHRRERIAGQPIGLSVGPGGRDDGDAGGVSAERIAKIPWDRSAN